MRLGRPFLRFLLLATVSALLVALIVRIWDEILSLRPREAHVYPEAELTEETAGRDDSEQAEPDGMVLPGISVRP
jgi:hypothetical protein